MQDIVNFLKEFNIGRYKNYLYIIFIIGIGFLILGKISSTGEEKHSSMKNSNSQTYQTQNDNLERRLEDILSQIDGVGSVSVMISYDSGGEKVVLKDSKTTKKAEGDYTTEYSSVVHNLGSGESAPFVSKEIEPVVRGVLVVAEGGEREIIKANLTNAVAAVLDIEVNKIKVLPKK